MKEKKFNSSGPLIKKFSLDKFQLCHYKGNKEVKTSGIQNAKKNLYKSEEKSKRSRNNYTK